MLIVWIRKRIKDEPTRTVKNENDSFQKHTEDMKKFSLSHPLVQVIKSKDIITADGNLLAAVQQVKLATHIQN